MDNTNNGAPLIPMGTNTQGGVAYNPLVASIQQNQGQVPSVPASPSNASVPTNAPDGTTFAELQAKKGFKSAEDLAKAYIELESHNKKVEMTAADILKQVYPEKPATVPAPGDEQAVQIVQAIVKNEVKPLQEKVALQELFMKNPDAKDFASGIAEQVKANPGITWESAYKLAKFDALERNAKDAGKQEAYQSIQQKQSVMAGTASPTPRGSGPDIRSIIKDRSVPFKEVDRMMREYLNTQQ